MTHSGTPSAFDRTESPVEPIHFNAMPVILTTDKKRDMWTRAFGRGGHLHRQSSDQPHFLRDPSDIAGLMAWRRISSLELRHG
jgi:hypothetical protein